MVVGKNIRVLNGKGFSNIIFLKILRLSGRISNGEVGIMYFMS